MKYATYLLMIPIFFLLNACKTSNQKPDSIIDSQILEKDTSSADLDHSWTKLKGEFQRRSDIIMNLLSVVNKSKEIDKDLIEEVKFAATDLSLFIDSSKVLDSLAVQTIYQKNNSLMQALGKILSKTLIMLENNPKLKSRDEYINLQMQLEGTENRIGVAKRDYNDICMKYNRLDLIFGNKAASVSF